MKKILLACDTYPQNPWFRDRLQAIIKLKDKYNIQITDIYNFGSIKKAHEIHKRKGMNCFPENKLDKYNSSFMEFVLNSKCNILILGTIDNYYNYLYPETIEKIKKKNIVIIGIFGDDEFTFDRNVSFVSLFDKIMIYVKKMGDRYNQIEDDISYYLPNSCHLDDKTFDENQIEENNKKYDVILVGAPFGNRPKLVKAALKRGINISIFGSEKWKEYDEISHLYKGYIESEKFDVYIRQSKIVLALLEDHIDLSLHMNTKIWEAIRVGQFPLVTNYSPLFNDYGFVEGENIATYSDVNEFVNKLDYYLNNPIERLRIARNMFTKVKKEFDYYLLYDKFFDSIQALKPRKKIISEKVKFIEFDCNIDIVISKINSNDHFLILSKPKYKYSEYINSILSILSKKIDSNGYIILGIKNSSRPYNKIKDKVDICHIIWEKEYFINHFLLNKPSFGSYVSIDESNYYHDLSLLRRPKNQNYFIIKKILSILYRKTLYLLNATEKNTSYDSSVLDAVKSHRSFDSMSAVLCWLYGQLLEVYPKASVINRNVFEIGTGQFLNHSIGFKILGAESVITIDKYRQLNVELSHLALSFSKLSRRFFSPYVNLDEYSERMFTSTNLNSKNLQDHNIEYFAPMDISEFNTDKEINLIFSYTVLEHVPRDQIKQLLNSSFELLSPGGYFIHFIDLEDHYDNLKNPFEFLRYKIWNEKNCYERGNRIRASEWCNIFDSFNHIEWSIAYSDNRYSNVNFPYDVSNEIIYTDDIDLHTTALTIIGRKK